MNIATRTTGNGRLVQYESHEEYDNDPRIRSTQLKDIVSAQGPRAYYLKHIAKIANVDKEFDKHHHIQPKVDDLVMGTLVHEYALEGKKNWFVGVERRGSAAWLDELEENDFKWRLTEKQDAQLHAWRDSMMRNKEAKKLVESGSFQEQAFNFTHLETEIEGKARVDLFGYDGAIWDLKTTRREDREEYGRDVINLNYYFSAAFYEKARNAVPEFEGIRAPFKHIVLCKTYPYYCYIWTLDWSYLRVGHQEVNKAFLRLKECKEKLDSGVEPEVAYPDLQELKQNEASVAPEWWLSRSGWETF